MNFWFNTVLQHYLSNFEEEKNFILVERFVKNLFLGIHIRIRLYKFMQDNVKPKMVMLFTWTHCIECKYNAIIMSVHKMSVLQTLSMDPGIVIIFVC